MRSPLRRLGTILTISLLLPITSIHAVPVGCSSTSSTVGTTTRLTFATTGACTWTVPASVRYIKFLIVAGGGGGGGGAFGGGGGGGVVITGASYAVTSNSSITINVGAGGAGGDNSTNASNTNNEDVAGGNGGDSSIGSIIAKGGGGGAGFFTAPYGQRTPAMGKFGGNQGGGSENSYGTSPFSYPTTQLSAQSLGAPQRIEVNGNRPGGATLGASYAKAGGGGGGANEDGGDVTAVAQGGSGGDGVASALSGTSRTYGGGGGGGVTNYGSNYLAGPGGAGGGGAGGVLGDGGAGTANTGGGGGGSGYNGSAHFGGAGGSGLVIITYTENICIENGQCALGSEGPAGGYIFYIDTATSTAYEASPQYWQGSCADGGRCNIGDTGFGGGIIFAIDDGVYKEIAPASLEFDGSQFSYSASYINATSPYPINGSVYGRWYDASVGDIMRFFKNRLLPGVFDSNLYVRDSWYWTTDSDPSPPYYSYIADPMTGDLMLINPSSATYTMRPFAAYPTMDSQEGFSNQYEWTNVSTGNAVGTGRSNTTNLRNSTTTGIAHLTDSLVINGKSDWFIPSVGEMKLLAAKKNYVDGLGSNGTIYWTSSSGAAEYAYTVNLDYPSTGYFELKDNGRSIRPIRSFAIAASAQAGLSLAMNSGLKFATFRTVNTITATSTEAGRVTFYADGKKISGCISLATSGNSVACQWKPSIRKPQKLSAVLKTSNSQYSTIQILEVSVISRTTRR
jgi:uncharacterized protein involved in tolerance to divalent cations